MRPSARITLAAAPLLALTLAACGSSKTTVITVAPSTSAAAPTTSAATSEATTSAAPTTEASSSDTSLPDPAILASIFPSYVRDHVSGLGSASDDSLSKLGHAVCSDFEQGNTFLQTAQDVIDSLKVSDYEGGEFTGAAIAAYCPQFKSKIPSS